MSQNMPSKAPNRPKVGFSIPTWGMQGTNGPEKPETLEAHAAAMAALAMRLRWQAQRLRSVA